MIQLIKIIIILIQTSIALAVDFKIDLPASTGTRALSQIDINDEIKTNNEIKQDNNIEINNDLKIVNGNDLDNKNTFDSHFPTPKCLKQNVAFWERIYRDVDVDYAVFHDRDSLERIFGIARLPTSRDARNNAVNLYRAYFTNKLNELAQLINTPNKWDKTHKELAAKFTPGELTSENVIKSAQNIRTQTGLKSRFDDGVLRSIEYIPNIQKIIAQSNLPVDIVFLPHVESGYFPNARSKVGAAGLWQLMPDTMRMLMGKSYISRRTEVEPSTIAAIKLLKQNYKATKSWPLALTAYNHGLNGVLKAINKTKSRDLCTVIERYESPSFRFASSNFYAQFLAARNIATEKYQTLSQKGTGRRALKSLLATRE